LKRTNMKLTFAAASVAVALLAFTFQRNSRHERYRPGDWVSYGVSRFISAVAVGPEYAYFGSNTGVLRYDAIRGRWNAPYTTSDGLASNFITAVGYDPNTSFLWCATDEGVSWQHPSSLRWTNYSKSEIGIAGNEDVLSIGFDAEANWFETRTQLFKQDKFGNVFLPARDEVPGNIVWFGLRREPTPYPLPQFFMPGGFLYEPARNVASNHMRAYGAVQDNRLRRAHITSALEDRWGNMWLGTSGLGAMRAELTLEQAELLRFGLANQRVEALLFNDEGLWIGGLNPDLSRSNDESARGITHWSNPQAGNSRSDDWEYFEAYYNLEISSDEVHNFAVHDKKLYCATENGIAIYDQKKDRWRRLLSTDGLADKRVNDVAVYNGFLYAATDLGLNRVEIKTIGTDTLEIVELEIDRLRHFRIIDLERQKNLLWIATERGPYVYDMAKGAGGYLNDPEGPRDEYTEHISFADSVVWIGTDYGLEAFDTKNKKWLPAPARRRFTDARINCIEAGSDVVWVGTDAGVLKYHRGRKEWIRYTTEDGLLDNRVNAIAMDEELVWFGTDLGITVFRWRAYHDFD